MLKLLVFDNNAPLYLDFLREVLQTEWDIKAGPDCTDWLKHEIGEADAAIGLQLHTQLLPYARRLKILLFPGAGTFHQDPNELPAGCLHANVYEHEIPIAEYVFFAMLALKTGLLDSATAFRRGEWVGSGRLTGEPHAELYGGTLGLIGFGHIGLEVARRAPAFGLGVQSVRRHSEWTISDMQPVRFLSGPDGVDTLLKTSDVVVVACPLTHETRGMLNRRRLRLLKKDAVLINVARAEIIEEEALYDALRERWFASAALDVWYRYPKAEGDYETGSRFPFYTLPNVLATPHASAWTREMLQRRARQMAANLDRFARGEPIQRVILRGTWRNGAPLP